MLLKQGKILYPLILTGLVACNSSNSSNVDGGEVPTDPSLPTNPTEPVPAVIMSENFDNIENGQLPQGWESSDLSGKAYVQDGDLYIDATAGGSVSVELPDSIINNTKSLVEVQNYRIDVDFTIVDATSDTRWVAVKYRSAGEDLYYQMAVRQNATATNGVELAFQYGGEWNIVDKTNYNEKISADKIYTATIQVYGDKVHQSLNGELLIANDIIEMSNNNIGLQANGALLKVENIVVTEQLTALPDFNPMAVFPVNEPETNVGVPPTLVKPIYSLSELETLDVTNGLVHLTENMKLVDVNGNELGALLDIIQLDIHSIPTIYLQENVNIEELAKVLKQNYLTDITFISSDQVQLAQLRSLYPNVRSALEISEVEPSVVGLNEIVEQTNLAKSKVVILPYSSATDEVITYLQRRLITVWVKSTSEQTAADILTTGANGYLIEESDDYLRLLAEFPEHTLLRKPVITAHRGAARTVPENTLEGAVESWVKGADATEFDVQLTKDGHVVVIHDSTVDRTTTGDGGEDGLKVSDLTLDEVKALNILSVDGMEVTNYQVPTLIEFFEEFKDKDDITLLLEIKSYDPIVVELIKEALDQYQSYNMESRLSVITFDANQAVLMGEILPEIPVGFLLGHTEKNTAEEEIGLMLRTVQPMSTTYNPWYGNLTDETIRLSNYRGLTIWPWTYRITDNPANFHKHYSLGLNGLTTDDIDKYSHLVTRVKAKQTSIEYSMNTPLNIDGELLRQNNEISDVSLSSFMVVSSDAEYQMNGDEVTFTSQGSAEVIAKYTYIFDDIETDAHYVLFSKPIRVTIK